MLITLSYRLPREQLTRLLGTVTAYPLTDDFQQAWENLPVHWRNGTRTRPPHASLATALRAVFGKPVHLFGESDLAKAERDAGSRLLVVTDSPLDRRFRMATRAWEQQVRRGDDRNTLSPLLPKPEKARPVEHYIDYRSDGMVPVAPNWVFRFATWNIMRRLATAMRLDGHESLTLRLDTDGSLLAWPAGDLLSNPAATAHAMARITARLVTEPGINDVIICFDAHLSHLANRWSAAKHVWIERGTDAAPILRLPVYHRPHDVQGTNDRKWTTHLSAYVPAILEACDLEVIPLPEELPPIPGKVRPQAAIGRSTPPLGSGLGPRFMLRLHEHIATHLPELYPLQLLRDTRITLPQRIEKYQKGGVPAAAIDSTGYDQVIIVCLYTTTAAHSRMLDEIQKLADKKPRPVGENETVHINDRLTVITHHCPNLLAHRTNNRAALLQQIKHLAPQPNTLIATWVETEYHPDIKIPREHDAKPHLRRVQAHLGIPSQFLATEPRVLPEGIKPVSAKEKMHSARAALRDLIRITGILETRVIDAITKPSLDYRLDQPALLVGLHVRRQQTGDEDLPLALTMTALHTQPTPGPGWSTLMYSEKRRSWVPIGLGIADFHSGAIGNPRFGRTGDKAIGTRKEIERRLAKLVKDVPGDLPIILFVDAVTCRTIWPGLQNTHYANDTLPGDTLRAKGRDVAIIRCNASTEIGRPVSRQGEPHSPARDPLQPAAPGRGVYQYGDSTEPVWLFPGTSRTYRSRFGDTGAHHTRWTLPEHLTWQLRKNWHSYTGTQIAVISPGRWQPVTLVALAARLAEQPISWDGRLRYPTPLHLAVLADKDHPDHRATIPISDLIDDEVAPDRDPSGGPPNDKSANDDS